MHTLRCHGYDRYQEKSSESINLLTPSPPLLSGGSKTPRFHPSSLSLSCACMELTILDGLLFRMQIGCYFYLFISLPLHTYRKKIRRDNTRQDWCIVVADAFRGTNGSWGAVSWEGNLLLDLFQSLAGRIVSLTSDIHQINNLEWIILFPPGMIQKVRV